MKFLYSIITVYALFLILECYLIANPKHGIVLSKSSRDGYSFTSGNMQGVIFGSKDVTVLTSFEIKTISVDDYVWQSAYRFKVIDFPYEVWMYQ